MKQTIHVLSMTQLYVYFIVIWILATSFGPNGSSPGQYLQKKYLKMMAHIVQKRPFLWDPIYIH
jgi:hypothetical protein